MNTSVHDRFIHSPDRRSRHIVAITRPPHVVWPMLESTNLRESLIIRTLFRARGLAKVHTLDDLVRLGFRVLDREEPNTLALGVIGSPWKPRGGLVEFETGSFQTFVAPGFAKVTWTLDLEPTDEGTLLSTETRISCTDEASRRKFLRYWAVIGPFSGLIRREHLRLVKRNAELA